MHSRREEEDVAKTSILTYVTFDVELYSGSDDSYLNSISTNMNDENLDANDNATTRSLGSSPPTSEFHQALALSNRIAQPSLCVAIDDLVKLTPFP